MLCAFDSLPLLIIVFLMFMGFRCKEYKYILVSCFRKLSYLVNLQDFLHIKCRNSNLFALHDLPSSV